MLKRLPKEIHHKLILVSTDEQYDVTSIKDNYEKYKIIQEVRKIINWKHLQSFYVTTDSIIDKIDIDVSDATDICGGPGRYSIEILNKFPNARVRGITIKGDEMLEGGSDWDQSLLENERFEPFYGIEGKIDGNIYEVVSSFIHSNRPSQLVIADGSFPVSRDNFQRHEWIFSRLILSEIMVGCIITSPGGMFIIKIFDTMTELTLQMLSLCMYYFTSMEFYTPDTIPLVSPACYIIFKGRNDKIGSTLLFNFIYTSYEGSTRDVMDMNSTSCSNILENTSDIVRDIINKHNLESFSRQKNGLLHILTE
jgi:hypothetical protein